MTNVNTRTGKEAEDYAQNFLITQGLRTVARNVCCRYGEIDIIMEQGITVVFVEVRLRAQKGVQTGARSVSYRKQQRLIKTASLVIQRMPELQGRPVRFDVIAYDTLQKNRVPHWIQQAFDASN